MSKGPAQSAQSAPELGNAAYGSLVRASLIVGTRYLALGVMQEYGHLTATGQSPSKAVGTPRTNLTPSTEAVACAFPSTESR
jgi:hypothetical protein